MLDINLLRRDLAGVIAGSNAQDPQPFLDVERFTALEAERKQLQTRTEELQARRNALSASRSASSRRKGEDSVGRDGRGGRHRRRAEDGAARAAKRSRPSCALMLMALPNLPHDERAGGRRRDGQRRGAALGHAARRSTSRRRTMSTWARRWGWTSTPAPSSAARASPSCAARRRACTARWRSSCSTCRRSEHGYTECYTPYIVNREILEGTGQLPKFKDDMFWVLRGGDEAAGRAVPDLAPREISLTNTVREQILDAAAAADQAHRAQPVLSLARPAAPGATRAA